MIIADKSSYCKQLLFSGKSEEQIIKLLWPYPNRIEELAFYHDIFSDVVLSYIFILT